MCKSSDTLRAHPWSAVALPSVVVVVADLTGLQERAVPWYPPQHTSGEGLQMNTHKISSF